MPRQRSDMAAVLEVADLRPVCGPDDVVRLVQRAVNLGLRGVCVNSCYVKLAAEARGTNRLLVVSTVGFPLGAAATAAKVAEAEAAVVQGADELDVVLNLGWFLGGRWSECWQDLAWVVRSAGSVPVKAILEAGYLSDVQIAELSTLALDAGAMMLKTSTGFGPSGASEEKVRAIRQAAGPRVPIKAAGGIRTWLQACRLLEAGANLLGTSDPEGILSSAPGA